MKIAKIRDVKTPTRGTSKSAGLDFYVPYDFVPQNIAPYGKIKIPSGIHAKIPEGFALVAFNKSSVADILGLHVGACLIDEDFQGEIMMHLINTNPNYVWIKPGMKLVQFVCTPVEYVTVDEVALDHLYSDVSERGEGGFGSTDKRIAGYINVPEAWLKDFGSTDTTINLKCLECGDVCAGDNIYCEDCLKYPSKEEIVNKGCWHCGKQIDGDSTTYCNNCRI